MVVCLHDCPSNVVWGDNYQSNDDTWVFAGNIAVQKYNMLLNT